MAVDAGEYILTVPVVSLIGAAYTGITAVALDAATVAWILCTEPLEVTEVGCFITVTTGANTFAYTFGKRQTMGGADIVLATVTGPAAAAVAVDKVLRRYNRNPSATTNEVKWTFDKGDLMKFTVSDTSAAGGKGLFYAKCVPKGLGGSVSAVDGSILASKNIAGTITTVDVASTT